jgi:hypothetical protein
LERAKRDYDFARWSSGDSGIRQAQPMQYVAPAADAPRPGTPSAGPHPYALGAPQASTPSPPAQPPFVAAAGPTASYWSMLSPSGELLPITKLRGQQLRAGAEIQTPPASTQPPEQGGTPFAPPRSQSWLATLGIDTGPASLTQIPPFQAGISPAAIASAP